MSEVRVNKLSPRSGTTVTLGDSGDTITIPSGVTFDASSGGLAGTLTTAAQPNITSVGTLTSFTSTGIDDNATSTAITIDSSENVGIGETSPLGKLHIKTDDSGATPITAGDEFVVEGGSGNIGMSFLSTGGNGQFIYFGDDADNNIGSIKYEHSDNSLQFVTNASERMRIDSSGDVFVSKTARDTTDGIELRNDGKTVLRVTGDTPLTLDRKTNEGTMISLRRANTETGMVATVDPGNIAIGAGTAGILFDPTGNHIRGFNTTAFSSSDDTIDIGRSSTRFQDIYATNGTIQTSDQNEKQSIQSLTTAEMNVAKRLSPLIKTFKLNSSVEEKGDSARTHTGIIAQDVQQAFTDEGLDAGNYALFISSTWWEKEISVEATEEKDAYTYIDTKEEATEGYTEKTRLGIRYSELLSFIQAYNDQRFTELEARITTLENA